MKRQDIITKLMNEGFTQKTLVNLSDKQLGMLAERILSEQYGTTTTIGTTSTSGTQPIVNVSKADTRTISTLKTQRKPFATYEGEMKEQEQLGKDPKKEKSEDEKVSQRIYNKAESKMKKGECIKSEVELLKRMKKNVPEKYEKYIKSKEKKLKKEVAEQSATIKKLPEEPAQKPTTKPISNVPVVDAGNKKIKTWVNKLVETRYFTSKNEIMELVQRKLNEQEETDVMEPPTKEKTDVNFSDVLSYDKLKQIAGRNELIPGLNDYIQSLGYGTPQREVGEPEIETGNPDVEEDEPIDPFKVTPGIDPGPKAGYEPEVHPGKPEIQPDIDPGEPEQEEPWDPYNPGPGIDPNPKAKTKSNIR